MEHLPRIQVSLDEIKQSRTPLINSLLRPLARRQGKIVIIQRSVSHGIVFAVSDTYEHGTDYQNWRFNTKVDNYKAMYYERWLPFAGNIYYLDRAYFHLYKTKYSERSEDEFICLHCDANEPNDAAHARFKQSPHLHLSFADEPIPHSHIALNNGNLIEVLSSITTLQTALKQAIDMIYDQILIPIKELETPKINK
jgi:hypothetical protein